jgi:FkbM family methyltransferase
MKKIARKMLKLIRGTLGIKRMIKVDIELNKERFGSVYGGWEMITKDIGPATVVYSFGVGDDITFDIELINRFGLSVYAFDPTPKSVKWVQAQELPNKFHFYMYGLAAIDGDGRFIPPKDPRHVSYSLVDRAHTRDLALMLRVKRISTIMQELGHTHIDILKMDIEGAEYDVIQDIRESDIRPKQILVEFHHRFPKIGSRKTIEAVDTLRSLGYKLYSFIWTACR